MPRAVSHALAPVSMVISTAAAQLLAIVDRRTHSSLKRFTVARDVRLDMENVIARRLPRNRRPRAQHSQGKLVARLWARNAQRAYAAVEVISVEQGPTFAELPIGVRRIGVLVLRCPSGGTFSGCECNSHTLTKIKENRSIRYIVPNYLKNLDMSTNMAAC